MPLPLQKQSESRACSTVGLLSPTVGYHRGPPRSKPSHVQHSQVRVVLELLDGLVAFFFAIPGS